MTVMPAPTPKRAPMVLMESPPARERAPLATFEELDKVAGWAASRWRRVIPRLSHDDLKQEAWLAIKLAERSFDPERGSFLPYARAACIRWLYGYVGKQLSPVSGSTHSLVALHKCRDVEFESLPLAANTPGFEDVVWASEVREQLALVIDRETAQHVWLILTGESSARFEERAGGPSATELYAKTSAARKRIAASLKLWRLWEEK